jgi:hypothetical protein
MKRKMNSESKKCWEDGWKKNWRNVNNIEDFLSLNPYKMEEEGGEGREGIT